MALAPGTRLGPYTVTAQIGVGGMGEVYAATDTNLGRSVAIKVLPDAVAADPERLARFSREAKTLAALNHPHIAAIYGLERDGERTAIVMELVEGPTLADRIAGGALPLDEALPIAKQIAEALEAAHEQGIIHRDLKPANIKVRADGTVKVLDFGLAKAMEPTGPSVNLAASQSPTITTPAMTGIGMILGTAAYMSPEQARGKPVDKRADTWAFGCILFEMLTGQRPFEDEDVSLTLSRVLQREPHFDQLPVELNHSTRQLIRSCLRKDVRERLADAHDIRLVLEGAFDTPIPADPLRRVSGRPLVYAAAVVVASLLSGGTVWLLTRPTAPRVVRAAIVTSGDTTLRLGGNDRDLAITPDGSRLVYRGVNSLQVRALDRLQPVTLTGLGGPRGVFTSPDGNWIGFFDGNTQLKKVSINGGPATPITAADGNGPRGATWSPTGTIAYATNAATGLFGVSEQGGTPIVLTTPKIQDGEGDHVWPEFLPDGRTVLFTITSPDGDLAKARIAILDLESKNYRVIVRGGHHGHYVPTGHLLYGAGGNLLAVGFDLDRKEATTATVPVIEGVTTSLEGAVDAVVSQDGTLAYIPGRAAGVERVLVWVDRVGRETPIQSPPRPFTLARLSPDGTRVAITADDGQRDIWVYDLLRNGLNRATFRTEQDYYPLWSRDGRALIYGGGGLWWQPADGTGMPERLGEIGNERRPTDVSPDGHYVIFNELDKVTRRDIKAIRLGDVVGPRVNPPTDSGNAPPVVSVVKTQFDERNGVISPDGRWIAFESDASGRFEVYVRPYPDSNTGQWQISTDGGTRPLWSHTGRELFYVVPGAMMVVDVALPRASSLQASLRASPPRKLFEGEWFNPTGEQLIGRHYDLSADDERFLMLKEQANELGRSVIVVQNWFEELKRLVPTQ